MKKATTSTPAPADAAASATSATQLIDAKIVELGGWRGATLASVRALIHQADPDVLEEVKWRGVPVWSHAGIICTGETYKLAVKLTFAKGAALPGPGRAVQCQPGRQYAPRHRHPRRRNSRCHCIQGADTLRRGPEYGAQSQTVCHLN